MGLFANPWRKEGHGLIGFLPSRQYKIKWQAGLATWGGLDAGVCEVQREEP